MKKLIIASALFLLFQSCSKEFDPDDFRDGQVVTIYVDHYRSGFDNRIFSDTHLTQSLGTYITGFDNRELGFRYAVKARARKHPHPVMDAPQYWFEYISTISKTRVDNEIFSISLTYTTLEYVVAVSKDNERYLYHNVYELKPENDEVAAKLDEVIAHREAVNTGQYYVAASASVSHDPDNWGAGLIVHEGDINIVHY